LSDNPYYLRGYRCAGALARPDQTDQLTPITTSQPDYSARGAQTETEFDLESIRVRDEYGLLAEADGQCVRSDTPMLIELGVGDPSAIRSAAAEVVVAGRAEVSCFDWQAQTWAPLVAGERALTAQLDAATVARACHEGALWLAVAADGPLELDYAGVTIEGDLQPFMPRRAAGPIVWPPDGYLGWKDEGARILNGALDQANGDAPAGWQRRGDDALYIRDEIVAEGTGGFATDKRIDVFSAEGLDLAVKVRPLDMLMIEDGPEGCTGNFLISRLDENGALRLRRPASEEAQGLAFRVRRWSGCGVVPGGCAVQCRGQSYWETELSVAAGRYVLEFFYRAYDPANMRPKGEPGRIAAVEVSAGPDTVLASTGPLACTYQWQRGRLELSLPGAGSIRIQPRALSDTAVEFTGFTLQAM